MDFDATPIPTGRDVDARALAGSVSFDYADATAVVTGGASGIGRAAALAFARAGATVVVADGRETPADDHASVPTHRVIREGGGTAEYVEFDRTTDDASEVLAAAREAGGADVLVDDAGPVPAARAADGPGENERVARGDFDRAVGRAVGAVDRVTRAAARDMVDRGTGGAVVAVAPTLGIEGDAPAGDEDENSTGDGVTGSVSVPPGDRVGVDAARAAVATAVRSAAIEFADGGVRVNGVVPGLAATAAPADDPADTERAGGRSDDGEDDPGSDGGLTSPPATPIGPAGYPEDVVPAVLFLASGAAGRVTGELLAVDGGQAARRSAGRSDSESRT